MGGLGFLSPLALGAMVLAAVPFLIHLFSRRKARVHRFAAVEFVLRSTKRVMRRVRLKQLILLALRTAAMAALALAIARPVLRSNAQPAIVSEKPSATVVVLDASYSMAYADGGSSLYERGKTQVRDLLEALREEDSAAVVIAGRRPQVLAEGLTAQVDTLWRALAETKVTYEVGDLPEALAQAEGLLAQSEQPVKRIFLVSDFTAGSLDIAAIPAPPAAGRDVALGIIDVAEDLDERGALPNVAVVSATTAPAPDVAPRSYRIAFDVENFGNANVEGRGAVFEAEGQKGSRVSVDVDGGERATRTFTYTFPATGAHGARIALEPDALSVDDVRYELVRVHDEVRVLIVDGDPHLGSWRDEVFYVERALAPGAGASASVRQQVITADDLSAKRLGDTNVVILANVNRLSDGAASDLKTFVQGGGGLFVATGDRVEAESYNRLLEDMLPMSLWDAKVLVSRDDADRASRATQFSALDLEHPLMRVFEAAHISTLKQTLTYAYTLLRPSGADATVLMRFDDGSPALVERAYGKGRVLLLATSLDRDWTDLPIKTAFVPILQQAVRHLAGSLVDVDARQTRVGETRLLRVRGGASELRVTGPLGPDSRELVLPVTAERAAAGSVPFSGSLDGDAGIALPGIYKVAQRVKASVGGDARWIPSPEEDFAVNVDPRESNTRRVSTEEIVSRWGGGAVVGAGAGEGGGGGAGGGGRGLWSSLLLAAVALVVVESALTRRT